MHRAARLLTALLTICAGAATGACAQQRDGGEPPAEWSYIASSQGRVYYPRACDAWRDLAPRNLIGFPSEAEAREAGYTRTTSRACADGAPFAAPTAEPCIVARVIDGDTLDCADGRRIRLLLIDTPELAQAPFGSAARAALQELLPVGARARVELDVQPADRYGRTLAYVYAPGGGMVNEEMARLGWALRLTYPPNVRHVDRIGAAVSEARAERRGLWSGSAFECEPRDYRAGRCGGG